ncbi:translocation/assembly module TamB domain-containing protein [Haloferula sp. A504]|uniref:translocation/assembly module TamB domain-containing protein n=1 Tax=Haloferula sp. A504 TaxID=3373601 RepID=UPI0031C67E49|nr:translocation/assembly module TamB [Verrucomicrobiaceae bacterium E54]
MSDSGSDSSKKPRRRFWRKKRWWLLAVLTAGLVWLDGPGWRWIARTAADHYLPDLGYEVEFELEGRLSSGSIRLTNVRLGSDAVVQVAGLDRLQLRYALSRVVRGEVKSLELDGLHVEVDLAAVPPKPDEPEEAKEKEPLDPVRLLTDLRQRLVPMNLQLRDVSTTIRSGDELVFSIEPTSILHEPGSGVFELDLGAMSLPGERSVAAQRTRLDWESERLVLDRLEPLEEVAIASLEAELGDPFRFGTFIEVADARFKIDTDLVEARLQLVEGSLSAADVARVGKLDLPLEASLRSLDLRADKIDGGLDTLIADLSLGLEGVDFDGWSSESLTLSAGLAADSDATATLDGKVLGSLVKLELNAALDRSASLLPTRADATLTSPDFQPAHTYLRDRFAADENAPPPPASSLELTAESTFTDGVPAIARATLDLPGGEGTPPLQLKARWKEALIIVDELTTRGLRLSGDFSPQALTYHGDTTLEAFSPASLRPWLAPWGIAIPDGIAATLTWKGGGGIKEASHEGDFKIAEVTWEREEETSPLVAMAEGSYDWPRSVALDSLTVRQDTQTIRSRLKLADRVLALEELEWNDGGDTLASGTASIPVPEDLVDWKALLRETRPITVDFQTPELPLSKLHPFLPKDVRFPEASRAKVEIDLTGTPAAPELVAKVQAKSLGLVSQPKVPPASLELDAVGKGHDLKVDGAVITADYPPAKISLVTNWDPALWAEDPETVKAAKLDGDLAIADLNLSSLAVLLPKARQLDGSLDAELQVGGTVGTPEPRATVTLEGGTLRMQDPEVPRIGKGTVKVSATPEEVTIDTISAEVSAGTVSLSGTVGLEQWKPGVLDLTLKADSAPAIRNESMIVRLDADLALKGPWETAGLSGTVEVVDSLFFKDIELLPIGKPMTNVAEPKLPAIDAPPPEKLSARVPEPFVNWPLDVTLKTRSPFLIRGNLANGEVYLDARVRGTVGKPRPTGEAKLREIVAQLPFSKLEIKEGKVILRPDKPFNPVLDIRGTSRIRPYDITVYISGPISDPRIQPTSSPPLPETEIMTLIATGTTTEGLEDPGAATARATQLLIEEARRGRIGAVKVLRPVFRVLDKVEFQVGEADPYSSKKFNSVSFDIDDNWVLTAGISEQGNTRTKVTYLFRFR